MLDYVARFNVKKNKFKNRGNSEKTFDYEIYPCTSSATANISREMKNTAYLCQREIKTTLMNIHNINIQSFQNYYWLNLKCIFMHHIPLAERKIII